MANIVYIAASLDGFIARPDGSLDWLTGLPGDGGDYGFGDFMKRIDAIVMGRKTFETVLGFKEWPYEKPVFVLSESLKELPPELEGRASVVGGDLEALVSRLKGRGLANLYIDGGRTIQSFLARDLIDELILTRVSVLLGEGIPLFGKLPGDLPLKLRKVEMLNEHLSKSYYTR